VSLTCCSACQNDVRTVPGCVASSPMAQSGGARTNVTDTRGSGLPHLQVPGRPKIAMGYLASVCGVRKLAETLAAQPSPIGQVAAESVGAGHRAHQSMASSATIDFLGSFTEPLAHIFGEFLDPHAGEGSLAVPQQQYLC
jgi:hypothetical protein